MRTASDLLTRRRPAAADVAPIERADRDVFVRRPRAAVVRGFFAGPRASMAAASDARIDLIASTWHADR